MPAKQASSLVGLPPSLRVYLYLTATLTGAIVLVVEILGAKMLTPWFGSSLFVWTAQITITLLALATGYYLGGWLADRFGRLSLIYGGLVVAAAYLGFTLVIRGKLAEACLGLDLALGAILASLGLYFIPLTLLAAVGPFFVRVLTSSVEAVGLAVGRLSALGTVGSVLGVLVTTFVFIPYLRDSVALVVTAGILVLLSAVYFLAWGRDEGGLTGASVVAALAILLAWVGLKRESESTMDRYVEVERSNSHFGILQVVDSKDGRWRLYLNDRLAQNTYDPVTKRSVSMFTYGLYHLSRGYTPDLKRVLCIGLGVGLVPRQLVDDGLSVDVVEINAAVVPVARRWFDFDPTRLNLVIDDARHFLQVSTNRYDSIQLDAFLGDSSPSHLMTREAFGAMHRLLNPGGTLVINSFASFESGKDFFGTSLHRTLRSVFANVRVHASPGGNTLFVASDRTPLEFRAPKDYGDVHPWARPELEAALARVTEVDDGRGMILTDDHNPVEFHDARNRENVRRLLARNAKSM